MQKLVWRLALGCLFFTACQPSPEKAAPQASATARPAYAIAIHGGAGALTRAEMTPEKEAGYRAALDSALTIGENILKNGAALDAVEQTVTFLEDCPLFNAGRGAVFTHEGETNWMPALWTARPRKPAP